MAPPKQTKSARKLSAESAHTRPQEAAAMPEALRSYWNVLSEVGSSCYTAWAAMQMASLDAAFAWQNAAVQATQAVFAAAIQANGSLADQLTGVVRQSQIASTKHVAATARLFESSFFSERGA